MRKHHLRTCEVVRNHSKDKANKLTIKDFGQKKVVRKGGQKKRGATKEQILDILRENPKISRKELSAAIGISQSAIQKHLNSLKNDEVIIRVGSARKGQWKILQ